MYVKVRTMDGKREMLLTVSRAMKVEDFKHMVEEKMDVKVDLQRLFYRGKQLENDYTLLDYNICLNDVIQLMIKIQIGGLESSNTPTSSSSVATIPSFNSEKEIVDDNEEKLLEAVAESLYYKTGDVVDCLNQVYGAWFEAIISKIFKKDDKIIYKMQWEFDDKAPHFNVSESLIRPRARHLLQLDSLEVGQKVMINYNVDNPKEIGFWYDFTISNIIKNKRVQQLTGILHIGIDQSIDNLKVIPGSDIFAIEEPKLLKDRIEDEQYMVSKRRRVQANCDVCFDNPNKKCRECGCRICAGKEDEHNLLLCDECDSAYHIGCLNPPLTSIPEEDYWYCLECKNDENEIVKAGDKLKQTKRKSSENNNRRKQNWDVGMSCIGQSKHCTIVGTHHVGPIPGVEVGTSWLYRVQVSEAGVHRPQIAGIHGRSTQCAYSIVLAGGYEDNIDNGDEFIYSGSGGRDLSGNKRTARQTCDQKLVRMNKALALNCNAKFNPRVGATAEYWRDGIPVRVVRNHKLAKFSKYAPKQGNRYDGIYKVVKYYPEIGKSGFCLWKFLLRRDDPVPAPWTKAGKARIKALGLKFIYPDGYLEAQAKNEISNKRKLGKESATSNEEKQQKRRKFEGYKLESEVAKYIEQDQANVKLWDECRKALQDGKPAFLQYVSERFTCPCCLELVYKPVTTPCAHNICLNCLKRSFLMGRRCCLSCRNLFDENYKVAINTFLSSALSLLYPGYKGGR